MYVKINIFKITLILIKVISVYSLPIKKNVCIHILYIDFYNFSVFQIFQKQNESQ